VKKTDDVMEKEILRTKITTKQQRHKQKHGTRTNITSEDIHVCTTVRKWMCASNSSFVLLMFMAGSEVPSRDVFRDRDRDRDGVVLAVIKRVPR
jgi:hypothetical protein